MSAQREKIGVGDVDVWEVDWTEWLAKKNLEMGSTVTLASASWSTTGSLEVLGAPDYPDPSLFDSSQQARCWWSSASCAVGQSVSLVCAIVTSEGHQRTSTIVFDVVQR